MNQIAEYLHIGGYAMFVWPAYGLALVGLVGILWLSVSSWKAREAEFMGLKSARENQGESGSSS
ncbi:MAG: heme exporter protein CcmD [Alphaproteobacteria bacterium]|jgi:heme exporter protein D|nr:heme exporter protein CcmD [Alphaproteobacteria bacterium]PHY01324.1 MAG: heme exporter protein CcmD [Rhodospirillaceae bacterium]